MFNYFLAMFAQGQGFSGMIIKAFLGIANISELASGDITRVLMVLLPIIILRDLVWKVIAMRKAGRNNKLAWFLCLLIFNTAGILPILYIFVFQPKKEKTPSEEMIEIKKESKIS